MIYFAYGSNMNRPHMQQRCPGVTHIGKFQLEGFRLVFKYHADIIPTEGCIVHGGLWNITEDHEEALDTYEGYPDYYGKYYQDGVMFYRMREGYEKDFEAPSKWYLKTIIQGYRDFGLTQEEFEESLGTQHLGLIQKDLEESLDVSTDELARLFSRVATTPVYQ
ncbi:gamma-glutamylcyclotransferase [Candidatus Poribacteria bacterium]|nr:gamma-glutamylcyclotransferase [Candidatus Poribacteria bacterium]